MTTSHDGFGAIDALNDLAKRLRMNASDSLNTVIERSYNQGDTRSAFKEITTVEQAL